MRFAIWPNTRQPWDDVLATARHAEQTGWDGVWLADHLHPMGDPGGPMLECLSLLAALAVTVPRVRIGSLVCGNTYRHPAVLTKQAATIDVLSGGRLVFGLGAGWQEDEHVSYGIPLPPVKERLDRFEEACRMVKELTTQDRSTFEGDHYRLSDAPLEPKPVQRPLPLLVGGGGEQRTLRIAARYADEWNCWGTPESMAHKLAVLDGRCAEIGRDPSTIARSTQALVVMSDDAAVLAEARASEAPGPPRIVGTPDEIAETIAAYAEIGIDEFILPDFNLAPAGPDRWAFMNRFLETVRT